MINPEHGGEGKTMTLFKWDNVENNCYKKETINVYDQPSRLYTVMKPVSLRHLPE